MKRLELPLAICRTKSGGAHLYLFTSEPVPAELMRGRLMEWSVVLGYAGVEIFPKQVLLTENENDFGNWINMPYYGGPSSTRICVVEDGSALTASEFLNYCDKLALSLDELTNLKPKLDESLDVLLEEGPPCLMSLSVHGFPQGSRNAALFNFGVYLRKRYGDDWKGHLEEYNQRFMQPALERKETLTIERSIAKKNYNYRCKEQPLCSACSRTICITRKFGVGGDPSDPGVSFGPLVQIQTEPEYGYIWDVDGARVEFTNAREILDQRIFHQRVMDRVRKLPNFVDEKVWRAVIREKLINMEVVVPPEDTTSTGQLWEHLGEFMRQRGTAQAIDELLLGRVFIKDKRASFRVRDFMEYLTRQRVNKPKEREFWNLLKKRDGLPVQDRLKGKMTRYWIVPAPEEQTEDFDIPRAGNELDA